MSSLHSWWFFVIHVLRSHTQTPCDYDQFQCLIHYFAFGQYDDCLVISLQVLLPFQAINTGCGWIIERECYFGYVFGASEESCFVYLGKLDVSSKRWLDFSFNWIDQFTIDLFCDWRTFINYYYTSDIFEKLRTTQFRRILREFHYIFSVLVINVSFYLHDLLRQFLAFSYSKQTLKDRCLRNNYTFLGLCLVSSHPDKYRKFPIKWVNVKWK